MPTVSPHVFSSFACAGTDRDELAALKYYKLAAKRGFADAYAM